MGSEARTARSATNQGRSCRTIVSPALLPISYFPGYGHLRVRIQMPLQGANNKNTEQHMNNQTPPPPPLGYPYGHATSHPEPFTAKVPPPPPPPAPSSPGHFGNGMGNVDQGMPQPAPLPPPRSFPNDPTLAFQLVDRDKISASAEAWHRKSLDPKRVARIVSRCRKGAHFPPMVLFLQPDGTLLLVDGLHRLTAFDQIGIEVISSIIIDDLATALVAGIRQNIPKNGKKRSGEDALRSLCLLATALGRKVKPPEAASLGLRYDDSHELVSPTFLRVFAPTVPPATPGRSSVVQSDRARAAKPKKKTA